MRILVAGASGFVGTALVASLEAHGHQVVRLVRRRAEHAGESSWSPVAGVIDAGEIERADAVVNLSGASLARLPWTRRYRDEILASRIAATRTLADAMRQARTPPAVFLSASAVGFYGDRPGERLDEGSAHGTGFLAGVVSQWEAQARLAPPETRTVLLRSGIVVGDGGALGRVARLTRLGVSARLGTGGQHWAWISLGDEVAAIVHLLGSGLSGPVNLVGPTPATADRVLAALASRLHRPYLLVAPERALELVLGVAADELLLASQKAVPERLLADGFAFAHPTVEDAIDAMLAPDRG